MSNKFCKILRFVFLFLLTVAVLLAACGGLLFAAGGNDTATYQEDALIVLGCGVEGTEPSDRVLVNLFREPVVFVKSLLFD